REFLVTPPEHKVRGARDQTDTRLWAVAYSPDGTRLAAADMNQFLWVWDADTLRLKFVVHTGDIFRFNCLAYSPDGMWIATGGASGNVKLWDAVTGQLVWDRGAHRGDLFRVSFGRDSRRLLDDANFATREAAAKELTRHALVATPRMRIALSKKGSLEQQRRLQRLLDQGDQLEPRLGLVVSVLAHLETPAARQLLTQWAEMD